MQNLNEVVNVLSYWRESTWQTLPEVLPSGKNGNEYIWMDEKCFNELSIKFSQHISGAMRSVQRSNEKHRLEIGPVYDEFCTDAQMCKN